MGLVALNKRFYSILFDMTESVFFHRLKYLLKLTYRVVGRCHDLAHDSAQCCRMTSRLK